MCGTNTESFDQFSPAQLRLSTEYHAKIGARVRPRSAPQPPKQHLLRTPYTTRTPQNVNQSLGFTLAVHSRLLFEPSQNQLSPIK
jgi:hypothetical protein